MTIRLAIIGLGKIARDQHLPAIARNTGFHLAAIASPQDSLPNLPHYPSLEALLASGEKVDAVSLCTPPQGRHAIAEVALKAGLNVLMEKPPGATVSEIAPLVAIAKATGRTLFATWHSRFAAAVAPARAFLADRKITAVSIDWKEDVRKWHPGQQWIWEPGGLGVFDPGINALSIITAVLPWPMFLTQSKLSFPANRAAPIAADLLFQGPDNVAIKVAFDWRQLGPQIWNMQFDTDAGRLTLDGGGKQLFHEGKTLVDQGDVEYDALYRHFADLIGQGRSDVDLTPLAHVADSFLLGRYITVEPFHDHPE